MIISLKDAFRLYTAKFEGVIILSLTILLPILLINLFLLNIVYSFVFEFFTSLIADFNYVQEE